MKIENHTWHWYLSEDDTLMIYDKENLYWEIENCNNYTNSEINILAKEFILQNQYMLD